MQLGLAIAVALLIIGVVSWPLMTRLRRPAAQPEPEEGTPAGSSALEDVYEAIRTLQMEHNLGRLTDDDFRQQLGEYRRQAALILRDMDRTTSEAQDA